MKHRVVPLASLLVVVALALAGCSSSTPNPVAAGAAGATATTTSAASTAGDKPSSAPPIAGTATDFCGAFMELQKVNDTASGDAVTAGKTMRAAASDMRKYAPIEVKDAAQTYADVMDNIGKEAMSGTMTEASLTKAIADGMSGKAKDIGTVALWVAKNCKI